MPKPQDVIEMEANSNRRDYVLEQVSKKGALLEFAQDDFKNDKIYFPLNKFFIKLWNLFENFSL